MQADRMSKVRERQEENKRLEEETRRMEEELERLIHLKEIENEKFKLKKELQELENPKIVDEGTKLVLPLRKYAEVLKKENEEAMKKKESKMTKAMKVEREEKYSEKVIKEDGENMRYFLSVVGLPHLLEGILAANIYKIEDLKGLKEKELKEMNISVKEQVKIIKKLRSMGI